LLVDTRFIKCSDIFLAVASSTEAPAEGQQKITYVGVSTEVTVGIALASFAIGVGLTGALWCIHMKTGMCLLECLEIMSMWNLLLSWLQTSAGPILYIIWVIL
jgi:hypothetical protein